MLLAAATTGDWTTRRGGITGFTGKGEAVVVVGGDAGLARAFRRPGNAGGGVVGGGREGGTDGLHFTVLSSHAVLARAVEGVARAVGDSTLRERAVSLVVAGLDLTGKGQAEMDVVGAGFVDAGSMGVSKSRLYVLTMSALGISLSLMRRRRCDGLFAVVADWAMPLTLSPIMVEDELVEAKEMEMEASPMPLSCKSRVPSSVLASSSNCSTVRGALSCVVEVPSKAVLSGAPEPVAVIGTVTML